MPFPLTRNVSPGIKLITRVTAHLESSKLAILETRSHNVYALESLEIRIDGSFIRSQPRAITARDLTASKSLLNSLNSLESIYLCLFSIVERYRNKIKREIRAEISGSATSARHPFTAMQSRAQATFTEILSPLTHCDL